MKYSTAKISDRIYPYIPPEYTTNETHKNIDFLIKAAKLNEEPGTNKEIKARYKSIFAPKAAKFIEEIKGILIEDCSAEKFRGYLVEYCFYKVSSAYFQSKIINPDKRQHWISRFYLKYFAHNGDLAKNDPNNLELGSTDLHKEFRMDSPHDRIYSDLVEEMLSKVEGDLSNLDFDEFAKVGVKTVHDYIVLGSFFSLLFVRTKEKIDSNFPLSNDIAKNFYMILDVFVTNNKILIGKKLKITIVSAEGKEQDGDFKYNETREYTVRMTQDPVVRFGSIENLSFIAPLTKDYLVIFLHEGAELTPEVYLSMFGIDERYSEQVSYHHPKENAISLASKAQIEKLKESQNEL